LNSYYTIDTHTDYVRAMSFSENFGRLFSISDDGVFAINDLNEMKVVQEYNIQYTNFK